MAFNTHLDDTLEADVCTLLRPELYVWFVHCLADVKLFSDSVYFHDLRKVTHYKVSVDREKMSSEILLHCFRVKRNF